MRNPNPTVSIRHSYKSLCAAAMFAAMIALTTAYLFHIPMGSNGGYVHFGDAFIYLGASLLPMPYACAAASIGGGLADFMSGVPIWIIPTMIIKPLTAIWFTNKGKFLCKRNIFALFLAGIVSEVGYYLAEVALSGSWLAPLASVWGIQPAGSAVLFIIMGATLDRAGIKNRLQGRIL